MLIGAYVIVVLVWSTTPLAIHLSNSSLSFSAAIGLRMLFALILCWAILLVLKRPLIQRRSDWALFFASGLGLFPNMLLLYWAAQYIPSGLMSVLMGIYPFFVGLLSIVILKENPFSFARILALVLALAGLALIHYGQLAVGPRAGLGVAAMIAACAIWALSSVLVKKLGREVDALRQGTGSMLTSLPGFIIGWWVLDGQMPGPIDARSLWGGLYLIVVGSVISHTLYFHVLRNFSVNTVSLITLMTPVLAVTWGHSFMGERFEATTAAGALCILISLAVYQSVPKRMVRWLRARQRPMAASGP